MKKIFLIVLSLLLIGCSSVTKMTNRMTDLYKVDYVEYCNKCGYYYVINFEKNIFAFEKDLGGYFEIQRALNENFYQIYASTGERQFRHEYKLTKNSSGEYVSSLDIREVYNGYVVRNELLISPLRNERARNSFLQGYYEFVSKIMKEYDNCLNNHTIIKMYPKE